jgi:hypothetical protein
LISCHSGLPAKLKAAFGLKQIEYCQIPGEKQNEHILGSSAVAGQHFPERYEAVLRELSTPHCGKVFLVAAGILGKMYCDQIKIFGGVAIDVGSLADAWVGALTRPGYDKAMALT